MSLSKSPIPNRENCGHTDYARLPVCIQMLVTPYEFEWMPDSEKVKLMQTETEPDYEG